MTRELRGSSANERTPMPPRLTKPMRRTLKEAKAQGLRRIHQPTPGQPPWPAHPATLHALTRHGLLEQQRKRNRHGWHVDEWRITDAGKAALKPRERRVADTPVFLARASKWGGDYTTDPSRRVDELEVIDVELPGWVAAARGRHVGAVDRRGLAWRLARGVRLAA
jgi:hypothetical protein